MPDLRSELMKLSNLSFDDPGEPEMQTTTDTKPMTERQTIWNYIRDNPMSSCAGISAALGVDVQNAASQVGALLNRTLVARQKINGVFHYTVSTDSYPTFDRVAHGKVTGRLKRKPYRAKAKAVRKLEIVSVPAKAPVSLASYSAKDMIESMPVGKARALYDELKKLFGN
jgi:hypothetical protein